MSTHHLLYLCAQSLAAYRWQGGQLLALGVFENSETGQQLFSQYLAQHRSCRFSLLTNLADEAYRIETIPSLRGKDRRGLIERKIAQHFPGTTLTCTRSLGTEKTQRKNEKLLLSALTRPALLAPWLHCLEAAESQLDGIFSLAQLGGALQRKLGLPTGPCLLLTQQAHSIRESYLLDGQTHFSRLVSITEFSPEAIARQLADEANTLQQYLIGQRDISREQVLPVWIVAQQSAMAAFDMTDLKNPNLQFKLIDGPSAARQIRLNKAPAESQSEALFLHLLASKAPRQQFADTGHRRHFHLARLRRGMLTTGLSMLLGSSFFAAWAQHQVGQFEQETVTLMRNTLAARTRHQAIAASLPQLPFDHASLRRLSQQHAGLVAQQRLPGPAFLSLSQAMAQTPVIQLDELNWKMGHATASTAAGLHGDAEIIQIIGLIRPDNNPTPRQTLATLDQFKETLGRDPANSPQILQRPVELDPGVGLHGGDAAEKSTQPAQFRIEVVRRFTP